LEWLHPGFHDDRSSCNNSRHPGLPVECGIARGLGLCWSLHWSRLRVCRATQRRRCRISRLSLEVWSLLADVVVAWGCWIVSHGKPRYAAVAYCLAQQERAMIKETPLSWSFTACSLLRIISVSTHLQIQLQPGTQSSCCKLATVRYHCTSAPQIEYGPDDTSGEGLLYARVCGHWPVQTRVMPMWSQEP
jgi:hypothetical protein